MLGRTATSRSSADEIIAATGFRPDLALLGELRLDLDDRVEAPRALAPLIDPNLHSCGSVPPHGVDELAHPERASTWSGMKSYGRAPTFLLRTGYEQVRSVVGRAGRRLGERARRVELVLPETGVCNRVGGARRDRVRPHRRAAAAARRTPAPSRWRDRSDAIRFRRWFATTNAVMTALPTLPGPTAADCCAPAAGLDPALGADRLAAVAKALGDPLRVQIFDVLRRSREPVCQCELIALFEIRQSLLSHHVKQLVDAGLLDVERRHKWAYYSVSADGTEELTAWLS